MKKLVKGGIAFGIGSMVVGKVGGMSGVAPGVSTNVNAAMSLGSMAMPITAAKKVTKSMDSLL